jgi:hypothetical protein
MAVVIKKSSCRWQMMAGVKIAMPSQKNKSQGLQHHEEEILAPSHEAK